MLHLVLYEPEIPQNTGNMMRTCMATNTKMHLIKPLGFSLDAQHLRRASMDYVKHLDLNIYENWTDFCKKNRSEHYFFMTRYAKKVPSQMDFSCCQEDVYFIVGKESTGVPKTILQKYQAHCIRIPMIASARSLNVSNCAAIILYEALRQRNYEGLSRMEVIKGEDWLTS